MFGLSMKPQSAVIFQSPSGSHSTRICRAAGTTGRFELVIVMRTTCWCSTCACSTKCLSASGVL